jgi:hypothetical protein
VVVAGGLIECNDQGVTFVDGRGGVKGFADELVKVAKRERGEFDCVVRC